MACLWFLLLELVGLFGWSGSQPCDLGFALSFRLHQFRLWWSSFHCCFGVAACHCCGSALVFVVLFSGIVFPNPRSDGDGCLSLVGVFSFFVDPQSLVNDSVLSFAL